MSASGVGIESFIPNLEGIKRSGDMNVIVPPSDCTLCDIDRSGSRTMVKKPKSARQARGGVSVTRILDCWESAIVIYLDRRDTDPFKVPVRETGVMKVLQTLRCPV